MVQMSLILKKRSTIFSTKAIDRSPGVHNSCLLEYAITKELLEGEMNVVTVAEIVPEKGARKHPRGDNIKDKFKTQKAEALQTQPENEIDEDKIYLKYVGDQNRKGVAFGTGEASPMFYNRPQHSSAGEKSYESGLVSKLTKENQALAKRMDVFEAWKAQMEASQGTVIPTPSCNPGLDSIREDNLDGDGGGCGGGDHILV